MQNITELLALTYTDEDNKNEKIQKAKKEIERASEIQKAVLNNINTMLSKITKEDKIRIEDNFKRINKLANKILNDALNIFGDQDKVIEFLEYINKLIDIDTEIDESYIKDLVYRNRNVNVIISDSTKLLKSIDNGVYFIFLKKEDQKKFNKLFSDINETMRITKEEKVLKLLRNYITM